jgi:hypothetical protein
MLQQLREQEGEVYSPVVQPIFNKYPRSRYGLVVAFGCAPANVDHLVALVQQEMAELRQKGPDTVDVGKYKAGIKKNTELALKDNGFWLGYLDGQYENGEDLLEVLHTDEVLDSITAGSLKEAAGKFLDGKNMIRYALLPESAAPVKETGFLKRDVYMRGGDTLTFVNKSPGFDTDQSYMDGYKVTARFFVWLEKEIDPAIVNKLDALMRSGKYEAGVWKKWTGRTLDQLWQSYTDKLGI